MPLNIHIPLRADGPYPDLFKFSSLIGERLQWFEGMIVRGEFYFAYPHQLNDPFEFRPRFIVPPGDPELHRFKLRRVWRQGMDPRELKRLRHRPLPEVARLMTEQWRAPDGEASQVQLFCMATGRNHPLLWAHYADGHRGACAHLDMRYIPLPAALEVHYESEYPTIPLFDRPDDAEVFRRLLFVKGLEWKYEGEYRVSRYLRAPTADLGVSWNGQLALASPNAVSGVTVGARISPENQAAILDMVRRRETPIPVWKAQADDERFAFTFERIV